jgi:hypothetical protein
MEETGMRMKPGSLILAALAVAANPAMIVPALAAEAPVRPAPAAAPAPAPAPAAHYSVATTPVGKMLDDPAANALLKKMIPTVYANEMFQTMGRELTLKDIQQYEAEPLSDENLAKIQAELNKIPAKS